MKGADFYLCGFTAQFLPGLLDVYLCKNKQKQTNTLQAAFVFTC